MTNKIYIADSNADPFNRALIDALGDLAQPAIVPNGDAVFTGIWDNDEIVYVLVERKRTLDFIKSMYDGHHLKQIQDAYAAKFNIIYFVVEGEFAMDPDGWTIMPWRGAWTRLSEMVTPTGQIPDIEYWRIDNYLTQLDLYLNVRVKITRNVRETATYLTGLFNLLQKNPEDHHTFRNIYTRLVSNAGQGFLVPPTLLERISMQLPGVGWTKGKAIASHFDTLYSLCEAITLGDVESIASVPGIGRKTAQKIIKESHIKQ